MSAPSTSATSRDPLEPAVLIEGAQTDEAALGAELYTYFANPDNAWYEGRAAADAAGDRSSGPGERAHRTCAVTCTSSSLP